MATITSTWPVASECSLVNGKRLPPNGQRETRRSEVPSDLNRKIGPEFVGIAPGDVDELVTAAHEGFLWLQEIPDVERTQLLADWVRAAVASQEASADEIYAIASLETALPVSPRCTDLEGPRARNQLLAIVDCALRGDWREVRIAPTDGNAPDARSMRVPWGVTSNWGPDTFPLAFPGVNGAMHGAAVMCGNADIAVSSWGTLATNARIHQCWEETAKSLNLHPGLYQFVHVFDAETAKAIVSHPLMGITGFTGGFGFGSLLAAAANQSGKPFLGEYGGPNGIVLGPAAMADQGAALGTSFANTCAMIAGTGLFCNAGKFVVRLEGDGDAAFDEALSNAFAEKQTANLCLVSSSTRDNYRKAVSAWRAAFGEPAASSQGEPDGNTAQVKAHVFFIDGDTALANWQLIVDAPFGPCAARIVANDVKQMEQIMARAQALACARWYLPEDRELLKRVFIVMDAATGRTVGKLGGTTAGIRWDSDAVIHTGPSPASNAAWFSTVGPGNVLAAFSRPRCWYEVPYEDLPSPLQVD